MRIFFLVLGSFFISIALFLIIIYLNLFTLGYTFFEFVYFIIRSSCLLFILGGCFFIYKGIWRLKR